MTESAEFREQDRRSDSIPSVYTPLIILTVYTYAINQFSLITADPDLWGHIKFGGEIWTQGGIPLTDTYSYIAQGSPWFNHEWLAEVVFYLIYTIWGSSGLLIFKLFIGIIIVRLLTFLTLFGGKRFHILYTLYFFVMIPALSPAFMVRPHLMTLLFLTLLVVILQKFFSGNHKILIWTPFLMLVWVNCHGGVIAGMGIYALVTIVECVRYIVKRDSARLSGILLFFFGLSTLALLANPYGYKLLNFLYSTLSLPRTISEWEAITILDGNFLPYKLLSLLFFATLFFPSRKRAWEIAITLVAVIYGFKHQRHSVLAAIIMTPYLFDQLTQMAEKIGIKKIYPRLTPISHTIVQIVLMLFIGFQLQDTFFKYRSNHFKILVEPSVYPTYALRFMANNGINGNIAVPFDWGEYVIWKLPKSKVSVDGRFETVYTLKVIEQNQALSTGKSGWRQILENYPTDIILTSRKENSSRPFEQEGNWINIYSDPLCMIFVPKTNPPGPILAKFYNKELVDSNDPPSTEFP